MIVNLCMCVPGEIMKLMLISLTVAAALVSTCCLADSQDGCTAQRRQVVKQQWTTAFSDDTRLRQFAQALFTKYACCYYR